MNVVEIAVQVEFPVWVEALPEAEALCQRAALAALVAVEMPARPLEVSLVLAGDAAVRALNRDWRGKDAPTNVLSFAALDDDNEPETAGAPLLLGDVVLAFETCVAEATAEGKPLADHLGHLVVHGMLHLLGFDHQDEADAEEMEGLETEILAGLGIADPYRPDDNIAEGGRCGP